MAKREMQVMPLADLLKKVEPAMFLDTESCAILDAYAAVFLPGRAHDLAAREFALAPFLSAMQKLLRLFVNPPPQLRSKYKTFRGALPGIDRVKQVVEFLEDHELCADTLRLERQVA
jgi:hypothetical protein